MTVSLDYLAEQIALLNCNLNARMKDIESSISDMATVMDDTRASLKRIERQPNINTDYILKEMDRFDKFEERLETVEKVGQLDGRLFLLDKTDAIEARLKVMESFRRVEGTENRLRRQCEVSEHEETVITREQLGNHEERLKAIEDRFKVAQGATSSRLNVLDNGVAQFNQRLQHIADFLRRSFVSYEAGE